MSDEERSIVTLNEAAPTLGLGLVCVTGEKTGQVRGHVNWFPVTATGMLKWDSYSSGAQDHDVNINFFTPKPNAVTFANAADPSAGFQRSYHTEFYSAETIERLPRGTSSLWQILRSSLKGKTRARGILNDRVAIMTGLFGIDGVHGYHAEFHPVYALAILIDSSTIKGGVFREEWAVMVRSAGSEGDCSDGMLPLLASNEGAVTQDFFIDFGTWGGSGEPQFSLGRAWITDTSSAPLQMARQNGRFAGDAVLDFRHPRPAPGKPDFLFLGTIFLDWRSPGSQPWIDRFASWTPNYIRRPIKLGRIGPLTELDGADAGEAPALGSAIPGTVLYNSLREMRGERKLQPRSAAFVDQVRVDKSTAWSLPQAVDTSPPCSRSITVKPLCLSNKRIAIGGSYSRRFGLTPTTSIYVYPHCCFREGEGFRADAANYLSLLGYRFDWRVDRFFPQQTKSNTVLVERASHSGHSLRLAPFLSPNTFRVNSKLSISPYTIGNFGVSWLRHDHGRFTSGWGIGTIAYIHELPLYTDAQDLNRQGGFASHWVWNFGALIPADILERLLRAF